ncbi:MAG: AsmA family protein [Pseudomonadota bacterium]
MRKLLRYLLVGLAALVALLIAAAVILPLVIDPDDYRDEIETAVADATGRELAIEGSIGLSYFPWLGVEIGAVELGNAEGFGPEPFARIQRAQVRVRVLPLFRGRAEVDTLVLDGLRLNLARQADGTTNWDDLASGGTAEAPAAPTDPDAQGAEPEADAPEAAAEDEPAPDATEDPLAALALGGIEVSDAAVTFKDGGSGAEYRLREMNLRTGALAADEPIPLALRAKLAASEPAATADLRLDATVQPELAIPRVGVRDLTLHLDARGEAVPGNEQSAKLELRRLRADLAADTLQSRGLVLHAAGSRIGLDTDIESLTGDPRGEGRLDYELLNPADLFGLLPAQPGIDTAALAGAGVGTDFGFDLAAQTASLGQLQVEALGAEIAGGLQAESILEEPAYGGHLEVSGADPRAMARRLGIALPGTADDEVLKRLALELDFRGGLDRFFADDLRLTVDDTVVSGSAGLAGLEPRPDVRFDLAVDRLDLDRYLSPHGEAEAADTETGNMPEGGENGSADSEDGGGAPRRVIPDFPLPVEPLRLVDADGTMSVGELDAAGLHVEAIQVGVEADAGRVTVDPVAADLYRGHLDTRAVLDGRGEALGVELTTSLEGFQAGPLLEDLMDESRVSGRTDLSLDLDGSGTTFLELRRGLDGEGDVRFRDGAIEGVNLAEWLGRAYARVQEREPPEHRPSQTDFTQLTASFDIREGVLRNDDLALQSPGLRVSGKGSLDLASEALDYRVRAAVVETLEGQDGKPLEELTDLAIPVHLGGYLASPDVDVELADALRQKAAEEAQKALEREKEKAEQRLREEEERAQQQLEEAEKALEERGDQRMEEAEKRLEERERETEDRAREKLEERAKELFDF